ncbi:unnamed protein product [Mucor hiemalis]
MSDNTSVMNVDGASVSEAKLAANETRDIVLPNQTEHVAHIAIDIGGSLAKIVYFTSSSTDKSGGRLHFKKIETERIDKCIDFVAELMADARLLSPDNTHFVLKATGGGAYLFYDKLEERLPGVIVQKEDEMDCPLQV